MIENSERASAIHRARVYLREARSRADNPSQRVFCFVLLGWAANARRQAVQAMRQQPIQGALFGGAA